MQNNLSIKNAQVLLPDGLRTCDLTIGDGLIQGIGSAPSTASMIDVTGMTIVPGLIDLHTHGIGFHSSMSGSLSEIAKIEASRGTTTFFPTLFGPPSVSADVMKRHLDETDGFKLTPQVGGFRLESPYLAIPSGGTAADVAPIDDATTELLLDASGGRIRIWDVSPELPGAADVVRYLSSREIVCSIAHTHAEIEQAEAVVDAGASLVTHLFDVFPPPKSDDPDPDIWPVGLIDYLLVEDRLTCEIIADGTHVHPLLVERAIRCKTPSRLAFVTDSNLGAGLPPGQYALPGGWGNALIQTPNDGVRVADRDMCLAGSALTPIDSFRNAVRMFGADLLTASRFCSETPAKLLGLNAGRIEIGRDADLVILDGDLVVVMTIKAGKVIYRRDS